MSESETFLMLLGTAYFALLVFWLVSLKEWVFDRFFLGPIEQKIWSLFSFAAGLGFAIASGMEWGLASAGTAVSLGFCITLALIDETAAVCLLASSLYLRPWELAKNDPYLSILPRFSILLCLAHLILYFAHQKKLTFRWNKLSFFLLAFSIWVLMSTLFSPNPGASQSEFFDGFLKSIILYFILLETVRTKASLKILITTLLLSFLFVAALSLYQTGKMGGPLFGADNRLQGFGAFTNSNDIAALMVFILPFSAVLIFRKHEACALKFLGLALSLVALLAILLSRSRGALLGVFAILGTFAVMKAGKRAIIPLAILVGVLAIPAMIAISNRSSEDLEGSSAGRKTYLKAGIRMGVSHPLFGVGFNAFPESLQTYSTESLEESTQMTAHNSFVLVFAETGLMGLILFSFCFFLNLKLASQLYPKEPEFLLASIGYGVSIIFLSHSYLIYPYLLYALVQLATLFQKESVS